MGAARIDQINVIVRNVDAASRFLTDLGIEIASTGSPWSDHHRDVPTATSQRASDDVDPAFGIDLDSHAFADYWGGLSQSTANVVVNIRVDERSDVDRLHQHAVSLGARSLKAPYDAFWGSRYAVVEGPGPLVVGLISELDPATQTAPPSPDTFKWPNTNGTTTL
jgi:predicted lactoylglutathione lyase